MQPRCRTFFSLRLLTIPIITIYVGLGTAIGAPQGGHGGGAGHALGGFHGGGFHNGFRGPNRVGYGYGYPYYGYPFYGVGFGLGLGYGGYGYGYPGYGYGGYPAYGYPAYADPAYPGVYPPLAPPPTPVRTGGVTLNVRVPADAVVWVNGEKTTQTGPNREFTTSGLLQGRSYTFDVRAEWPGSDGKMVNLERRIPLQAGERRIIDFEMRSPPPEVVIPTGQTDK